MKMPKFRFTHQNMSSKLNKAVLALQNFIENKQLFFVLSFQFCRFCEANQKYLFIDRKVDVMWFDSFKLGLNQITSHKSQIKRVINSFRFYNGCTTERSDADFQLSPPMHALSVLFFPRSNDVAITWFNFTLSWLFGQFSQIISTHR